MLHKQYMRQRRSICACGNPSRQGGGYCLKCHREYVRIWRKSHPLTQVQRFRMNCRSYSSVYLKRGKLIKENCESCGSIQSQMHHEDYSKPLFVTWLCRICHLEKHRLTK